LCGYRLALRRLGSSSLPACLREPDADGGNIQIVIRQIIDTEETRLPLIDVTPCDK
jgi:hypothetical protein